MAAYFMGITGAAIINVIAIRLIGSKGAISGAVKLITSLFLLFTVLSPLLDIRLDGSWSFDSLRVDGEAAAAVGESDAKNAMAEIITEQVRAYILDKAESLGVQIDVTITCDDSMPPVPCGAQLRGRVSPYAKKVLSEYMEGTLGIPMEAQEWTG